jgi:signal transduction histidine kinase
MIKKLYRIILLLLFLTGHSAMADRLETPIDFKISHLLDSSGRFNIQEIQSSKKFTLTSAKTIDFGTTQSAIWLSIDIPKNDKDLLLTIENCHLDSLEIFLFSDNQLIRKTISGDLLPFDTRYLQNNFFNFLVDSGTNKIYIRTKTQGMSALPIQLFTYKDYYNYYQSYVRFHWTYFGLVILTILSNILFYFWLKESIYIKYVFCVLGIGIVTAVDFEYSFQFLWPESPWINKYNIAFYGFFIFTILFTDNLLNIRKNLPKIYPVFIFFYCLSAAIILLSLLGYYNAGVLLLLYSSPLVPVFCLLSGILIFLKDPSHVVKFYLIGWTLYFVFMFLYIITWLGVLPINIFSTNLLPVGSSFEIIFLNLAILSKINTLKKEKETILSNQNKMLEEKVHERTLELYEKSDEILSQNEELINQQAELEAQRDTLERQNRIIEDQNILLQGSKDSLEKIVERRTEELEITNQELIEYNHRLEQFAFVTAHNLRGPVATLLGLAQIYNKKDGSDPINLTILEQADETTKKLDGIIRDLVEILDLQKSAANLLENINTNTVLNDVRILLSKEIEESNAVIEHNFSANTTLPVVSAYINNIFYNLISNSIKYRKEHMRLYIQLNCTFEEDKIKLSFTDNGRGVDLEKFGEKIFSPYKRFHLDKEGKGLGLYLVKTQVEIMKGSIGITSSPDKGCTITILLPVKKI